MGYAAAMARTAELVPELNAALAELEGLIYSEDFCTEGGLSLDDIDLWSRLRSVTLVKGAQFGEDHGLPQEPRGQGRRAPVLFPGLLGRARAGWGRGVGGRCGDESLFAKKKELKLPPSSPPFRPLQRIFFIRGSRRAHRSRR